MRKIKEFLRPWFTQGTAIGILLLILAFQPMIDLDYLIYPFFKSVWLAASIDDYPVFADSRFDRRMFLQQG